MQILLIPPKMARRWSKPDKADGTEEGAHWIQPARARNDETDEPDEGGRFGEGDPEEEALPVSFRQRELTFAPQGAGKEHGGREGHQAEGNDDRSNVKDRSRPEVFALVSRTTTTKPIIPMAITNER